ncbi:dienelactone hydrolase family protein [Prochlorococcus sp. MIT 1341]|uniref:dienelactone hydrolase family protein n=1 Tax=Prochlorococcus sp. MIT 1341 TaxID=3096221 RepID=UPI002A764020|nr:dienelactone hydrolase family protein [Prochlorococcus sp. MIT 1341]
MAIPLSARTAQELELGYSEEDLVEGRRHKELTTTEQILTDVSAAIEWLKLKSQQSKITGIGFCFGGHAALITSTHPAVSSTFNFYGAGVNGCRPGGCPPSLELLPTISGELTCLCGSEDPLISTSDRRAIKEALKKEDPEGSRLKYNEIESADHGFMCEQRSSFNALPSEFDRRLLLDSLNSFKCGK